MEQLTTGLLISVAIIIIIVIVTYVFNTNDSIKDNKELKKSKSFKDNYQELESKQASINTHVKDVIDKPLTDLDNKALGRKPRRSKK